MSKKELIIYEGVMCCSSGVCGPEPDKKLIDFNNALRKLKNDEELNVVRASLSHDLSMFLDNKEIFQIVKENGPSVLPIVTLNGKIMSKRNYLTYEEFKQMLENGSK
jgi:hypothetical protein